MALHPSSSSSASSFSLFSLFSLLALLLFTTVAGQENAAKFVSSRGILKSCDIFPAQPRSSAQDMYPYDWANMKDGAVIYVQGSAVPAFVQQALPQIKRKFTLVTGDCDESIPEHILDNAKFQAFIENPLLVHWFSQNLVIKHPKMSNMPIGMDYHTMTVGAMPSWGPQMSAQDQEAKLVAIAGLAPPLSRRAIMCYANFQFLTTTRYAQDRRDAMAKIPKELVYYEPSAVSRAETWKAQSLMAFVISPHGGGYDCHRTWEALALGCIPIVKTSPIDPVFEGLPVLIVKDWSEVTLARLRQVRFQFAHRKFDMERITLKYWMERIRTVTQAGL